MRLNRIELNVNTCIQEQSKNWMNKNKIQTNMSKQTEHICTATAP